MLYWPLDPWVFGCIGCARSGRWKPRCVQDTRAPKASLTLQALAFSRLKPEEQYAFLLENPQSWLNPANQTGRHGVSPPMRQAQYPAGGSGWGMFGWGMPGAGNRYWPNGGGQHGGVAWGHPTFPGGQMQTPMYAPQPGSLGRY